MANASDGAKSSGLKMITSEGGSNSISTRSSMPTPNTLARLEDPRSWHARGEVGIQHKRARRDDDNADVMVAYPMAPPPPGGRAIPMRKVVLEEEEYVERLGDIIEGDYFPHNAKMFRALAKMAQRGGAGVRDSATTPSSGSVIGTPSAGLSTPGGSTPAPIDLGDGSGAVASGDNITRRKGKGAPGTGGALTRFVAMHTSEDNEAFAELQEKDQEAFRKRYFWAYEPANGEGAASAVPIKLLMMPDGKMMSVERRAEMDAACADRPKIGDHRPIQVETWKHRTRNQLMFSPNLVKSNDTCRIQEPQPLMIEEASKRPSLSSKRRLTSATGSSGNKRGEANVLLLSGDGERNVSEGRPVSRGNGQGGVGSGDGDHAKGSGINLATAASADADSSSLKPDSECNDDREESREEAWGESSSEGGEKRAEEAPEETEGSEGEESRRSRQKGSSFESQSGGRSRRAAAVVVKGNPKVIQAHATRFPMLPPPPPRPPHARAGKWASPIESPSSSRESVAELLAGGSKDKDASGDYSEVPMTPSRVPGVDGDSPQITWGSIDGTPMILDPRATPLPDGAGTGALDVANLISGGPRFEIKDLPEREKLAHRLEADDTRRKRAKLGLAGAAATAKATPTPTSTPCTPQTPSTGLTPGSTGRPRSTRSRQSSAATAAATASLTPAARTLALKLSRKRSDSTPFGGGLTPGRQTRRSGHRRGTGGEKGGGLATPTPSTPGSVVGRAGSGTPRAAGKEGSRRGGSKKTSSSLTDGLLAVK